MTPPALLASKGAPLLEVVMGSILYMLELPKSNPFRDSLSEKLNRVISR
jgi:hypothetical protein